MRFSPSRALAARWLVSSGFSLLPAVVSGQLGPVAGTVTSRASGAPVADVQVTVAGTTLRALTDASGRFRFSDVPGTMVVLQARRIGFRAAEDTIRVGNENVRIAVEEKVLELSQVVVTGTPTATARRELGIAVSRIDAATVTQTAPINDVQSLLNGRAAGVLIQPATGAVGSGSRIRIRGASSFSIGNQPLLYVDGVRVDADFATGPTNQAFGSSSISRFNDFNPDDIESVEIVKGPAATTLYGTEASNGVIQVITKRGTPGPARWDFTLRQGVNYFSNPEGRFPTNYQLNGTGNLVSINLRDLESQVGDIFRTGRLADSQASVSGGSSLVRYYVAGGTELQGGAEPSNDLRHSSGRANLVITPSDRVTLSANVGYVSGPTHVSCEAGCGGRMFTTFYMNPQNLGTFRLGFHSGLPWAYDEEDHVFAGGLFSPAPGLSALGATTGPRTSYANLGETKSLGFYGQEQVAWRDRLFLTAGLRSDDQSTFGANFNRVYYPKASASWVISEEPFWKSPFFNQVRLRAAYGESGRAPPYNAAVPTYTTATGPGDLPAVTPQNIGNPDLGPERGKEIELGFDAGFWNDRLGLEFTYYRKRTTDEILLRQIAPSIGFSGQQYINAGAVLNQGIELLVRARPYSRGPASVDLAFNLATNNNKILGLLPGFSSVSAGTFLEHRVGYPVGSWFAKRVVSAAFGANRNATDTTNVKCDDGNGGAVPCYRAPTVYLGRTIPNFEGAFITTITLGNRLRLGGLLDFKTGYKKLDGNTRIRCTLFIRCPEDFAPFRSDPIRVAEIQAGIPDFYINDASFLKLREVSVSYTLPEVWAQAIGASRALVSLAGRNLYTWTRYLGLEPEAMFLGGSRGGNFSAWEQADLPQLAQWVMTVNVSY